MESSILLVPAFGLEARRYNRFIYWAVHHIDLKHEGLRKFRRLSGADKYVLEQRARIQTERWDERWRRRVVLDRHTDELLHQLPDFVAQKARAARLSD